MTASDMTALLAFAGIMSRIVNYYARVLDKHLNILSTMKRNDFVGLCKYVYMFNVVRRGTKSVFGHASLFLRIPRININIVISCIRLMTSAVLIRKLNHKIVYQLLCLYQYTCTHI